MQDDPRREEAEKKAFRLLTLRAHSEKELGAKLRERGFAEGVVAGVVEKCRGLGYLNDGNFARQRARELAVNRLMGDRRIALDLRERGIPEELTRQAIKEVRGELGEEEALGRLLAKRLKRTTLDATDEKEKARLMRGLLGKGFPAGLVFRKLRKAKEEEFHGDDGE
jgi:regulatory protein